MLPFDFGVPFLVGFEHEAFCGCADCFECCCCECCECLDLDLALTLGVCGDFESFNFVNPSDVYGGGGGGAVRS